MVFSKLIDALGLKQYLLIAVLVTLGLAYWRFSAMSDELDAAKSKIGLYAANEKTLIDAKADAEAKTAHLNDAQIRLDAQRKAQQATIAKLNRQLADLKGKDYANPQNRKTVECLDAMAPDADGMLQPDK